jgi:hypothetical protein
MGLRECVSELKKQGTVASSSVTAKIAQLVEPWSHILDKDEFGVVLTPTTSTSSYLSYVMQLIKKLEVYCRTELARAIRYAHKVYNNAELRIADNDFLEAEALVAVDNSINAAGNKLNDWAMEIRNRWTYSGFDQQYLDTPISRVRQIQNYQRSSNLILDEKVNIPSVVTVTGDDTLFILDNVFVPNVDETLKIVQLPGGGSVTSSDNIFVAVDPYRKTGRDGSRVTTMITRATAGVIAGGTQLYSFRSGYACTMVIHVTVTNNIMHSNAAGGVVLGTPIFDENMPTSLLVGGELLSFAAQDATKRDGYISLEVAANQEVTFNLVDNITTTAVNSGVGFTFDIQDLSIDTEAILGEDVDLVEAYWMDALFQKLQLQTAEVQNNYSELLRRTAAYEKWARRGDSKLVPFKDLLFPDVNQYPEYTVDAAGVVVTGGKAKIYTISWWLKLPQLHRGVPINIWRQKWRMMNAHARRMLALSLMDCAYHESILA